MQPDVPFADIDDPKLLNKAYIMKFLARILFVACTSLFVSFIAVTAWLKTQSSMASTSRPHGAAGLNLPAGILSAQPSRTTNVGMEKNGMSSIRLVPVITAGRTAR